MFTHNGQELSVQEMMRLVKATQTSADGDKVADRHWQPLLRTMIAAGVLHDVGTIKSSSGHRLGGPLTGIDTPTLRGVASTGPYLHDGSAPDLASVFNSTNAPDGTPHASFRTLNATQQNELIGFLLELDGSDAAAPIFRPQIDVSQSGNSLLLRWPGSASGFSLRSTTNLTPPITWTAVTNAAQSTGGVFSVTLPLDGERRFFLLQEP